MRLWLTEWFSTMPLRPLRGIHQQVYHALHSARRPLSAYGILDLLRPHGVSAPPTVYRALNRLVEDGYVHRLESLNAYVACGHDHDAAEPALFMICSGCGQTEEFTDIEIARRLDHQARARGFHSSVATVELRGQCASCAES